jgi:hypothetical protein
MNDKKKIIDYYQSCFDKGINPEDLFALIMQDGHSTTTGFGLLMHFFKMSLTQARDYAISYSEQIEKTKLFEYSDIVIVVLENNKEGHIATATHDPVSESWTYGVVVPPGEGEIKHYAEKELLATGRKVKPIKKQGIIQFWAEVTETGQVIELVKKLKHEYFDVVKVKSAEVKFSHVTGKKAVIVAKILNENFPQPNKYGLYILNDQDEMQFYFSADERHLEPTDKKLAYSFQMAPDKIKLEDIKDLSILVPKNSSIKLSDKKVWAVRKALAKYDFLSIFNKYKRLQIFVSKEIFVGDNLIDAHGPVYEATDIDRFETPINLPRQNRFSLCLDNLVQVKIFFTAQINLNESKQAFEFRPYILSLLVNSENSTIWDARGWLSPTN